MPPRAKGQGGLALPAGTTLPLTYTNVLDPTGKAHLPFSTPNGLVAPGQLIHVAKPISAFQDQLQIRRTFGKHTVSFGTYFANYSQDNHWFFTQILTDVGTRRTSSMPWSPRREARWTASPRTGS